MNFYFLKRDEDGIRINDEKVKAVPQEILPVVLLHGDILYTLLDKFLANKDIHDIIFKQMKFTLDEVRRTDIAHENFLIKNGNHSY